MSDLDEQRRKRPGNRDRINQIKDEMNKDVLRTRIAAAIYNASDEYTRKLMVRPDCPGASELAGSGKPICYTLADAVIAELQPELTRHDTGCVCDECW